MIRLKKSIFRSIGIYGHILGFMGIIAVVVLFFVWRETITFQVILIFAALLPLLISSMKNYWYIVVYDDRIELKSLFVPSLNSSYPFSEIREVLFAKERNNPITMLVRTNNFIHEKRYMLTLVSKKNFLILIKILEEKSIAFDVKLLPNSYK